MTDNGAGNPRFAFIPKSAWDLILDLAPLPLAGIAIWFSVLFVAELVHDNVFASGTCTQFGSAFGPVFGRNLPRYLIPTTAAVAVTLYFLLNELLRPRQGTRPGDCASFGESWMHVVSAVIVAALLGAYWILDATPARALRDLFGWDLRWSAAASVGLCGAWALAAVTALALRRAGKRFEVLCLLPPVACLAAAVLNFLAVGKLDHLATVLAALLPSGGMYRYVEARIIWTAACLTACIVPLALWAEWRLFHSSRRAMGIACAGLWALAAVMAWNLLVDKLMMYNACTDPIGRASYEEEWYFAFGIAGAFILAACIRLWVHARRVAACRLQALPR